MEWWNDSDWRSIIVITERSRGAMGFLLVLPAQPWLYAKTPDKSIDSDGDYPGWGGWDNIVRQAESEVR